MSTSSKPDNVRVIQFTSEETRPFSKCSEIDARMVNCNEIPWFVYIPDYECGTAETCDLADKGEEEHRLTTGQSRSFLTATCNNY